MILKGNSRGGAKDLALHLMKDENEHIEVHELRGFASDTLMGALNEAYAVSRGTRCQQFLYSLSLNPPAQEVVGVADFEAAIDQVEEKLGLSGQPRAIVFHEKEGRRHAHAVWSRIDTENMKAVQMSFDHRKLKSISRELFLEHGWSMPRGLMNSQERDPRNFTLAEWQQAKRAGKDAREIKAAFQDCWAVSDSRQAFERALEERGFRLAKGDRRGFVGVDMHGEVYAVSKWAGIKTKDVRAKLGSENDLPSVDQRRKEFAAQVDRRLNELKCAQDTLFESQRAQFESSRKSLVRRHKVERLLLSEKQKARSTAEALKRQARYSKGIRGLFDRLSGGHRRIKERNELEAYEAMMRDRAEKEALIFKQMDERRGLQARMINLRQLHTARTQELKKDIRDVQIRAQISLAEQSEEIKNFQKNRAKRQPSPSRDFEP